MSPAHDTNRNRKNIPLECGMIQSSNSIYDYKETKSFPFKPKNIDYVFLCMHILTTAGESRNLSKKDLMARLSQPQLQATIKADATRLL